MILYTINPLVNEKFIKFILPENNLFCVIVFKKTLVMKPLDTSLILEMVLSVELLMLIMETNPTRRSNAA